MTQRVGRGQVITLDAIYRDSTPEPADATDPRVSILDPDDLVVNEAVPVHVSTGYYQFAFAVPDAADLGAWTARWTGLVNGNEVGPVDDLFIVDEGGSTEFGAGGPCEVWPFVLCADLPTSSAPVTGALLEAATEGLWAASGRQFGQCLRTVQPCTSCTPTWWTDGLAIWPALIGGRWFNLTCDSCIGNTSPCRCSAVSEFWLPYGASTVVSITIDGSVVPTGSYAVHDGRVARVDGESWPRCNDGDWTVVAGFGRPVPRLGELAVGELLLELARGCAGDSCALSPNVISRVVNGITETFPDPTELVGAALDVLPMVTRFLRAFNPYGLAEDSKVWSPDFP